MHGDSRGCPCIDRARGAVLSNGENGGDLSPRLFSQTFPFLTEQQHRIRGQIERLNRHATRQVVDTDQHNVISTAPCGELQCALVMTHMLISVGDHGSATIPALATHDVNFLRQEGIRGTHDGADIEVVVEILDGHVERMSPGVEILDDRLESPISIFVDDISAVAVAQQIRIKSIIVWPRKRMRAYAVQLEIVVGAGVRLIHTPTIAWQA